MKNLVFQYYIPYEANDAHMGGIEMPVWAEFGSKSAQKYARACKADYILSHERYFKHLGKRSKIKDKDKKKEFVLRRKHTFKI